MIASPSRSTSSPSDSTTSSTRSARTPSVASPTSPAASTSTSCQDLADDHHFVFYELYADEDAVAAHRAAPHFAAWRAAADRCVVPGSQVNTLVDRAGPPRRAVRA